jgi:cell division protease FtsH
MPNSADTPDRAAGNRAAGRSGSAARNDPPNREPAAGETHTPWRVEGPRPDQGNAPALRWRPGRPFWWTLVVLLILNWLVSSLFLRAPQRTELPYTLFRTQVQAGNVSTVNAVEDALTGKFRKPVRYPAGDKGKDVREFGTHRPSFADDNLFQLLASKNVEVTARAPAGPSLLTQILIGFGPTLLLVGLFIVLARRATAGGAGGLGGIGKSKARRFEPEAGPRTGFDDVAGIDEVEDEVTEIVDFLRSPDRYTALGATMPKGVLLSGPPGTGKTLLARAVAGEAGVPFYIASASEFIEMIVGVGASRVRDLFDQAKKNAPAIIFIDELDAIGRARGGAMSVGGHDEREQTLNQILTEMDGFTGRESVIVLAATNRPEILDSALLRPGRFDRRLTINPPDSVGRRKILDVHVRKVTLGEDVDLDALAAATPGMVGAELANLVNEAALVAARRSHTAVQMGDFTDALERLVLGTARRIVQSAEDLQRTAYHESGHALIGMLTLGADPVRKISIVPRGHALGVTFQAPDIERYGYSTSYLQGRIAGMLGGRAAEQLIYGDITTGAENDIEQATSIARQMVGRWGMSPAIGPVSVLPSPAQEQQLAFGGGSGGPAPATRELVDVEIRRILDDGYSVALDLLTAERSRLDRLARALVAAETLDSPAAYAAAGVSWPGPTAEGGEPGQDAARPGGGAHAGSLRAEPNRPTTPAASALPDDQRPTEY